MKHEYIVFTSFIVVIMFIIMAFSGITSQQNSQNNDISTSVIKPLSYGLTADKWSVSGKTCAPSSATIGNTVTLKIDVTSFSESKCAGPTIMYFYVNYKNDHTVDVRSTGVYTYNWNVGLNYGNINFHAEYLSESAWEDCPARLGFKPMVFFRNAYSTFGDSTIHVKKYLDVTGYDGNGSIYLSNICGAPGGLFYSIYHNFNITDSSGIYHGDNEANKSIIVGKTAYIESDNGKHLYISLNLTDVGAGAQSCSFDAKSGLSTCTRPYKLVTDLQTSGAPSDVSVQFCNNEEVGYNVTDMDSKSATEMQDEVSLIGDGFSLIPVAGYAVTGAQAAGTAYNLIHCVTTKPINGYATGNNLADIKYCITGGSMSGDSYVKNGQNVYASGIEANIKVPNSQLNSNFKIDIKYATEYECGSRLITDTRATTTQTINAVTASAICGSVGQSNTSQVRDPNLTSSLYIENNNTHNFHIVSIRDGYFYFFAQPDTTYKLYYMDNGKLHEFYHISNNKITGLNSITTSSAGNSTPLNIWK